MAYIFSRAHSHQHFRKGRNVVAMALRAEVRFMQPFEKGARSVAGGATIVGAEDAAPGDDEARVDRARFGGCKDQTLSTIEGRNH